ncbi:MAG: hypothetical protein ISS66_13180 [Desulfobacteraceae bacterium]|nr:hypothetical protein [Desulfobacteraceae bacterium]
MNAQKRTCFFFRESYDYGIDTAKHWITKNYQLHEDGAIYISGRILDSLAYGGFFALNYTIGIKPEWHFA